MDSPTSFRGINAYLIGIGGCGMSGLARMLATRGSVVSGSDSSRSEATDALAHAGIPVSFDQCARAIPDGTDLVVASAAIKPDHPEILAATQRGLPVLTYAEALGRCMEGRTGIAIAGTHGKSTTVAMLGHVLIRCGLDPTVIVGATCGQLADPDAPPTGFRLGADRIPSGPHARLPGLLLAEACEFNRSFHALRPMIAAITSVEADHLDVYGSLDAVVESFAEVARLVPPVQRAGGDAPFGRLLIAHNGAHRREVTAGIEAKVETIGFAPGADWHVTYDVASRRIGLNHKGRQVANWAISLPGEHMALDSAIAATLALWVGAPADRIAQALGAFTGVDRRMQLLGEVRTPASKGPGVRVYDDYGHHPTEVDTTLRALREFERPEEHAGRLICVFQPHQHSRTRFLLDEFARAFAQADVVIVPHIYFVRDSEVEKTRVSAADLVDRLRERGVQAMHLYPFEAIVEQLKNLCHPGDTLVVMGAGPVWRIAHDFMHSGHGAPRPVGAGVGTLAT